MKRNEAIAAITVLIIMVICIRFDLKELPNHNTPRRLLESICFASLIGIAVYFRKGNKG